MSSIAESFEHAGLTVEIHYEEGDASYADPRDMDQLGTLVCWHPDYALGDLQLKDGSGRGAVKRDRDGNRASTLFMTERGRTDFRGMESVERYLRLALGAVVVLPLYLLDHSGISMSAGYNTVGMGDTAIPGGGRDSWGNSRGWDTTMVGFIYTTKERIAELCGEPRESDPFYCPRDWEGTAHEWIVKQLRGEVEEYDSWLRGEVYWYAVKNADGETLESCGGFVGDIEYAKQEARESAECEAREIAADMEPDMEGAAFAASRS